MSTDTLSKSRVITTIVVLVLFMLSAFAIISQTGVSLSDFVNRSPGYWLQVISSHKEILAPMGILALYCILILSLTVRKQSRLSSYEKSIDDAKKGLTDSSGILFNNPSFSPLAETQHSTNNQTRKSFGNPISFDSEDNINSVSEESLDDIESLKGILKKTESKLDSAKAVKTQFLANMSHELRTPMNGILGMTELLMGSGLNDKQNRFADSVRRSAESLLGIINDLLDYSRMEAGNLLLEKATFNIRDLVEDVCDLHAEYAQSKGLELICHVDKQMHEFVSGDSNRMRQLLTNLIGNAIKFTKKGEIVVRIRENEKVKKHGSSSHELLEYQIDVVDTGVGISPEGQARIFESFTQADDSYAREYGGAGLGLFITHRLLTMMGGKITLRSRMEEGSHFTVVVNLDKANQVETEENKGVSLAGVRVLIVDDNETNRTILFHQLKSWGIIPEVVESGSKALAALRQAVRDKTPFHIAILDLHMPAMDGLELTRAIQEDGTINSVKRMMLTSAVMDLDLEHLEKIGVSQYISKPARQTQLFSVLADLAPESMLNSSGQVRKYEETYVPLNLHVLLAEDNLINQEVAENMLSNFGCTSEVVSTGAAAVKAVNNTKFDIVLMDCQMPVMDGLEATRRIREGSTDNKDTPVIALTANVLDGDKEKCIKNGMNGYIGKPVKQDELYGEMVRHVSMISQSFERAADEIGLESSQGNVVTIHDNNHDINMSTSTMSATVQSDKNTLSVVPDKVLDNAVDAEEAVSMGEKYVDDSKSTDASSHDINQSALDTIRRLQRPGKPDLVAKVVNVYLDKSPELINAIVSGFAEGDVTKVKEAAHSMKSSSAYIGADKFSEKFRQIEATASKGNLDEIKDLVATLEDDFENISANLKTCIQKAA